MEKESLAAARSLPLPEAEMAAAVAPLFPLPFSLSNKYQYSEMYAADGSYRSLDKLGMTGRRFVVILNGVKDLYIAPPAYTALCEHPAKLQFIGVYAAGGSYRSLDKLGMTTARLQRPLVAALIKRQYGTITGLWRLISAAT